MFPPPFRDSKWVVDDFQCILAEFLNREEDCMTVHTETIGCHVMIEVDVLSSFGKCCQRFSKFVADSWRRRVWENPMDRLFVSSKVPR